VNRHKHETAVGNVNLPGSPPVHPFRNLAAALNQAGSLLERSALIFLHFLISAVSGGACL